MTEILTAALLIMTAIAVWLAWVLTERSTALLTLEDDYMEMIRAHDRALTRNTLLEKESLAFAAYKREVEEGGYADAEVQRLRAANGRLAVQLAAVYDRVEAYRDWLLDAGHDEQAEAFQKWLDGSHDDVIH